MSAPTRAAASSIASGMPSRRRQISATSACSSGPTVNPGRAEAARSANSRSPSASARHPPGRPRRARAAARGWSPARAAAARRRAGRRPGPRRPARGARSCRARAACPAGPGGRRARRGPSAAEGSGTPIAAAAAWATKRVVADARELDEPHLRAVAGRRARGHLERQARLAGAAGPGQREQRRAREQPLDLLLLARAADERREPAREVVAPRRRARPRSRDELAVQRARLGLGVGAELGAEVGPQLLEGRERLGAATGGRVGGHQRALRALGERVGGDRLLEGGERRGRPRGQLRELQAERRVQLAQRDPPRRGPRLVAVLGQQLAGVELAARARGRRGRRCRAPRGRRPRSARRRRRPRASRRRR